MKILALDTATETLALGLAWGERSWRLNLPGGAAASQHIIPSIQALLAQAGLALADLDGLAFGQGPGAFTGVRTAVSVTQGLAFGLGRPVVAVDSLQILVEDAADQVGAESLCEGDVFWALADARMGEIYAAAYVWSSPEPISAALRPAEPVPAARSPVAVSTFPTSSEANSSGSWRVLHAPALLSLEAAQAAILAWPPRHAAGSALSAFSSAWQWPADTQVWPDTADRAGALLRLARAAWQTGAHLAADQALPVYLRDKVAQTTAERELERAAKRLRADNPSLAPLAS